MLTVKVIPATYPTNEITALAMEQGQIGRVIGGSINGHLVLRTADGAVDLNDSNRTWANDSLYFTVPAVEVLRPGDKVELTVGLDRVSNEEIIRLRAQNKILAIKRCREITLWGLKESKEYVDNL